MMNASLTQNRFGKGSETNPTGCLKKIIPNRAIVYARLTPDERQTMGATALVE